MKFLAAVCMFSLFVTGSFAQGSKRGGRLLPVVHYVDLGFTGGLSGSATVVAEGPSCLEFDHVEYDSNGKDKLTVWPVMKQVSSDCSGELRQLEIPIQFELNAFQVGPIFLSVKSCGGKSVRAVIERK